MCPEGFKFFITAYLVPKYFMAFPIYIKPSFKKMSYSMEKNHNSFCNWSPICITYSETTMNTKMFAKKQSSKEQKLTELLKFWVSLKKVQDFLDNPHAVQKLS